MDVISSATTTLLDAIVAKQNFAFHTLIFVEFFFARETQRMLWAPNLRGNTNQRNFRYCPCNPCSECKPQHHRLGTVLYNRNVGLRRPSHMVSPSRICTQSSLLSHSSRVSSMSCRVAIILSHSELVNSASIPWCFSRRFWLWFRSLPASVIHRVARFGEHRFRKARSPRFF